MANNSAPHYEAEDLPLKAKTSVSKLARVLRALIYKCTDRLFPVTRPNGNRLRISGRVFDTDWYREQNPDISGSIEDLSTHFFRQGMTEGRNARFFDPDFYTRTHKDVAGSYMDALSHYRKYGETESRQARFIYVHSRDERIKNRSYSEWIMLYDRVDKAEKEACQALVEVRMANTSFAIWLYVAASADEVQALAACLEALNQQSYQNWVCHVVLEAEMSAALRAQAKIIVHKMAGAVAGRISLSILPVNITPYAAVNDWFQTVEAEFITLLGPQDNLSPNALSWAALAIGDNPRADMVYADEDSITPAGKRYDPYFKSKFNYELLLSHNYCGDLTFYRRAHVAAVEDANRRPAADDCDLLLRAVEQTSADKIIHIPRILNHIRGAKSRYASWASAIESHLQRVKKAAEILAVAEAPAYLRVRYKVPMPEPLVTIIIPTRDRIKLLRMCLESLFEKTTYSHYEVIIVDNGSIEPETLEYFDTLDPSRVKILRDARKFNYSALNNEAVKIARGDVICLMNNDIEIITPGWMEEMLGFALQKDVGCVGARLWYPDDTIQHAGVLIGFHGVAGHMHKFVPRGQSGYANRAVLHQQLSAVTAAVLMVRKEVYKALGGLDETLAVAFNDVDFCLRVRDAGYRNIYVPAAEMYHHESASRGSDDTPEKKAREKAEIDLIKKRYGDSLMDDPAYSPNLTLTGEDLSYAFPPRVKSAVDMVAALNLPKIPREGTERVENISAEASKRKTG